MPTEREHSDIKSRAAQRLLALPGVVAVGLGNKEVNDHPTEKLAIKIFVKVKRPLADIPADEQIPAEIEGVPTDVIQSGEIRLQAAPPGAIVTNEDTDDTRYRPLTGGGRVRREDSNYSGTLGCFLVDTGDTSKRYGLTCFHVVDVPDVAAVAAGTSKVGQPSGVSSVTACCNDVFGTFVGGAKNESRDEALLQLEPGTQWLAEIAEIGIVSGKHTLTQAEVTTPPESYNVRKRGARTLLTGGVVRALEATTTETDNIVVVKPNPNPAAGAHPVLFTAGGDSGAAYVNDANEILALHWAGDESGNSYGHAITRVLEHFTSTEHFAVDVAVAVLPGTVNTVPGAAMVRTPPELASALGSAGVVAPELRPLPPPPPPGWVPEPVPLGWAPGQLEQDLDRSAAGRLLMTIWLEHQVELLTLVNTNRRVTIAWHRSGASALFQALARMPTRPDLALPPTINGQPLAACIDHVQRTLDRFASARLRRDLARRGP